MKSVFKMIVYFRVELRVVLIILVILILLPIIVTTILASSGINEVANALASADPVDHTVEIKDVKGNITNTFEAATLWPVCGIISDEFGTPHLPWQTYHTGIDIANNYHETGSPITTFMEGVVTEANVLTTGYGKHLIIDHGNNVTSLYGHMSVIEETKGQHVKPGDIIGLEGSTGASTGPHVHFEIRVNNVPVNPHTFMVGEPIKCNNK